MLVPSPALEATLEAVRADGGWLHTSPEFALKRVLAAGLPRIFAITPCFRADELGPHHAREFTMLEFYAAGGRYLDLCDQVEALVAASCRALGRSPFSWTRTTVSALFGGEIPPGDDAFFRRWVGEVEPRLVQPTFVLDWPARHAALAEVRGAVAERVEVYLGGLEIGNGFSELADGGELEERFAASAQARRAEGRDPHPVDRGVIDASARMPRCAGIAIGVDRLVMAVVGEKDIAGVRVAR